MLSARNKLNKHDFDVVKEKGKIHNHPNFSFLIYNRKDDKPTRFGFVISKKVSHLATLRNKVKRALGHGVRHNLYRVVDGYDCIVLAKPSIARKYVADIMKEVDVALKHDKLIKTVQK